MMGMGFGLGGLGLIIMLIFWVVVIGLAVWFLSNVFPSVTDAFKSERKTPHDSSLEILEQRLARGEISKDEFEEIRELLLPRLRSQSE